MERVQKKTKESTVENDVHVLDRLRKIYDEVSNRTNSGKELHTAQIKMQYLQPVTNVISGTTSHWTEWWNA